MKIVHTGFGLLLVCGLMGGMIASSSNAHAQANCKWYGTTSLKQQQQNEKLKCGFSGPQWHNDLMGHINWCKGVSPDEWKKFAQDRDKMLAGCAAK